MTNTTDQLPTFPNTPRARTALRDLLTTFGASSGAGCGCQDATELDELLGAIRVISEQIDVAEARGREYGFIRFMTPAERLTALRNTYDEGYRHALKVALTEESEVTLDGERAKITGYNLPFAVVRSAKTNVEFSWQTVARVVANGGAFES